MDQSILTNNKITVSSLNVGYTSINDIAMVLREENVYSYDNATMFGQGDLSHSFVLTTKEINTFRRYKVRKNSDFCQSQFIILLL